MEYQSFDEAQLGVNSVFIPFIPNENDSEMSTFDIENYSNVSKEFTSENNSTHANPQQYYESFLPELIVFHSDSDSTESDTKFEIPGEPENVPGELRTFLLGSQTLENIPMFVRIKKPSSYKKKVVAFQTRGKLLHTFSGPHVYMEEIKTSVPRFVAMLWKIVTDEPCCKWVDCGTMFSITNEKQFINILSKYFKHSNFSSFRRQLSLYGFRQLKAGKMIWGHQNFNRDNIKLLSNLKRKLKI